MKKIIIFGIMLILLVGMVSAFNTTSLITYWDLDNNAVDLSDIGNNGSIDGANCGADVVGKVNSSCDFDGVNDNIGESLSLDFSVAQPHTYSLWFKQKSFGVKALFYLGSGADYNSGKNLEWMWIGNPTTSISIVRNGIWESIASSTSINLNQWYHMVMVNTGTNLKIYINGNLENSTAHSYQAYAFVDDNFELGSDIWDNTLNGSIDEFSIFKRELTSTEILELYTCGVENISLLDCCTPLLMNTSWSSWTNISCVSGDTMNQTRNLTQYDTNSCGGSNTTFIEYQTNGTCTFEIPTTTSIINNGGGRKIFYPSTKDTNDFDFAFKISIPTTAFRGEEMNVNVYSTLENLGKDEQEFAYSCYAYNDDNEKITKTKEQKLLSEGESFDFNFKIQIPMNDVSIEKEYEYFCEITDERETIIVSKTFTVKEGNIVNKFVNVINVAILNSNILKEGVDTTENYRLRNSLTDINALVYFIIGVLIVTSSILVMFPNYASNKKRKLFKVVGIIILIYAVINLFLDINKFLVISLSTLITSIITYMLFVRNATKKRRKFIIIQSIIIGILLLLSWLFCCIL
jgi:hypothetical protein